MSDLIKQTVPAGQKINWRRAAGLFLMNEAGAALTVQILRAGVEIFNAVGVGRGVKVRPVGGFDEIVLHNTSGADIAVEAFVTAGDVDVQISTGLSVEVLSSPADPVHVSGPLTDAQLRAAPVEVDVMGATMTATNVGLTDAMLHGAFVNTQKTITNADGQLLAANAARRYLLIQNKDASAQVWVKFGAGAATAANGVLLAPGASYECQGYVPSGEVRAIGDVASNANVVVVEG